MEKFILPENLEWVKPRFSEEIKFYRESVSVRSEFICRWFSTYFSNRDYLICEIENWRYCVEEIKSRKAYVFQMYSDSEMSHHASKYFFPALSNPWEPWIRKHWYWTQAPDHVSWGWYFIWQNGEKILTNPFKNI